MRRKLLSALVIVFVPLFIFGQLPREGAVIRGTVTDAETGEPLVGTNVLIGALNIGDASGNDGTYRITIPANLVRGQEAVLTAQFIGYHTSVATVILTPGTITQDFSLASDVLGLEEIVVTGVVGEMEAARVPFAVGRLSAEDLEVPAVSAEGALRGKIAGVRVVKASGQPGSSASVQLRGATSINATDRSQEPLYIVDGVILSEGGSMADIDAQDIEKIEVVKGAAGASLYGSRAAHGVVQITTKRGKTVPVNQTRITVRSETGYNELAKKIDLVSYHAYKIAETSYTDANGRAVTPGDFIDKDGNWLDPRSSDREIEWFDDAETIRFQDKPYKYVCTGVPDTLIGGVWHTSVEGPPTLLPEGGFDHIDRFFDPGQYQTSSISVAQNTPSTNFFASFTNTQEPGVLYNMEGNNRNSLRVNLDHNIRRELELSVSTYYSQSTMDEVAERMGTASPLFDLTFMPVDVDLLKVDEWDYEREALGGLWLPTEDQIFIKADPTNTEEENPIYQLLYRDRSRTRNRFLTNARLSYRPLIWFGLEANLSLDRTEHDREYYYPKGYKSQSGGGSLGSLDKYHSFNEAINADVTASFNQTIGALNLRSKLRYLYEEDKFASTTAYGRDFGVGDVPSLDAAIYSSVESEQTKVIAEGYYFIGGADYAGKYIVDLMYRKDGSSLFGAKERWHNYYRYSGAYRISEEPFWLLKPLINELKLRFSLGTAGSRPAFEAQYETYPISGGLIDLGDRTLGNKTLKPEFATETEMGLDFALLDRIRVELTSAKSVIEDQILLVPLKCFFGYKTQWQNAGELTAKTLEARLQAVLMESRDLSWSANLFYDRTTQVITDFKLPSYTWAPPNTQDMTTFYNREGETLGDMYGTQFVTSKKDLPEDAEPSEFQVNDDGYVVWVGAGNSYTQGLSDSLWGTSSADGAYSWGIPIEYYDEEEGTDFVKIGSAVPDFHYGFSTNLRLGPLTFYALFEGQAGGHIYNMTSQWGMRDDKVAEVDQYGKAEGDKKPTVYYQKLYNVREPSGHFVEDGSYLKLQELSIRYGFSLPGLANRIVLGVVGRNLITWTDYSGYDPEVGIGGGQGGSAVLTRFDGFGYPNFRSYSFIFEVEL
ncbi:MAG: SusC/RagA family TonB-linked outer membrane protein [Candidatus Neomarinimicrobiota bacterium]